VIVNNSLQVTTQSIPIHGPGLRHPSVAWLYKLVNVISNRYKQTIQNEFRSLLLILKQITSVFAIIINLFIWHFYSLPYYNIQFTIDRYDSKIHMHIWHKSVVRQLNWKRPDKTIVKRKGTKGQTMICKTLHRRLKKSKSN
jgi:hypothetical protein